jgi:hypothetical protein
VSETYLIAIVSTDRNVYRGEFESAAIVPSGEVREYVDNLLAAHAGPDAQMQQEARDADWQLRRWRGEPVRLCGYLTRYDIYSVRYLDREPAPLRPDGVALHRFGGTVTPDAGTWNLLADEYETFLRHKVAVEALTAMGWDRADAGWRTAENDLAKREAYEARSRAERAAALAGELSAMLADGRLEPDEDKWATVLRLYLNDYTVEQLRAEVAAGAR